MGPAVFFDLGGTLVDRARDREMCAYWSQRGVRLGSADVAPVLYRADRHFMECRPELWRAAGPEFQSQYWGLVHAELGLTAPAPSVCAQWGGPWHVYPDAWGALRQLRRAGTPLALVSNWDGTARRILALTGLGSCFDVVAVSAEVGWEKPDPQIFRWTAERLGVRPEDCLHVGDNYWDDVVGAGCAAVQPVLLHRHPEWCAAPTPGQGVAVVTDLQAALPYLLHPRQPMAV